MTIATDLAACLEPALGPAEERIHTAVPPIDLGGGAEVLEFRRSTRPGGCVYVSAGASSAGRPEIVLVTRAPEPWAPTLVSKVAAAGLSRRLSFGGTLPLGDGPVAGLAFSSMDGLGARQVGPRWTSFLLALGVTTRELSVCRSHGVDHVAELLRAAGVFPFAEAGRGDVPAILSLGPSAIERKGLSGPARDGLFSVIHRQDAEVEALRARFPAPDLALLAQCYSDLGTLGQRAALVQLVQDNRDPAVSAIFRGFVADAARASTELLEQGHEHASLAVALSALEGDFKRFDHWFDDLAAARARARELAAS